MASDVEAAAVPRLDGVADENRAPAVDEPTTPLDTDMMAPPLSQQTLPSTEAPASPIDPSQGFKTEATDDRPGPSTIIPSSLTPPPSSQVPTNAAATLPLGYGASRRSNMLSPPVTGFGSTRRESSLDAEYSPPTPQQVVEASPDELRSMLQACIGEHAKLKMEAAHHKLQYSLLSMQADEDAKRAAVEHEMTRREVDALRVAEHSRQARRELSAASESAHTKYLQLRVWYEELADDNEALRKRVALAKKVIRQKEEEIGELHEEKEMLLVRLRENREHFHMLCSPGGIFHSALTPKTQPAASPAQYRSTPHRTPGSANRDARPDRDRGQENLATLLQAISQENNSAPSTPLPGHRPPPRLPSKHTRNVQSLSSLPTTPSRVPGGGSDGGLLPSVDLVPQTEPAHRYGSRNLVPETPIQRQHSRRKSRESTISADDNGNNNSGRARDGGGNNEELARQALAASASFASRGSQNSRGSHRRSHRGAEDEGDGEVYESRASQAALEMLRRDPRESFEMARSRGSTPPPPPAAAEKSAKLQAKMLAGLEKGALPSPAGASDKRKFSGGGEAAARAEDMTSPTKRLRVAGGLREPNARVGLGIQYGRGM